MKRKPGILSLVSSRSQELRESSHAPLWWKGPQGTEILRDDDYDDTSYGDNHDIDYDDNEDDDKEEFITISEREHVEYVKDEYEKSDYGRQKQASIELNGHSHLFFGVGRTPETMASWSGQPSVKGSTDTSRMMLLTSASLGIAWVAPFGRQRRVGLLLTIAFCLQIHMGC